MSYSVYPAPVVQSKGPLDITWTNIGYNAGTGVSTYTFNSIGGYRMLKLVLAGVSAPSGNNTVTFNGDTTSNYSWFGYQLQNGAQAADNFRSGTGALTQNIQVANSASGTIEASLIIENATDTTAHKHFVVEGADYNTTARTYRKINGIYRGTSAITSLTITSAGGNWTTSGSPWGFYLYGAN